MIEVPLKFFCSIYMLFAKFTANARRQPKKRKDKQTKLITAKNKYTELRRGLYLFAESSFFLSFFLSVPFCPFVFVQKESERARARLEATEKNIKRQKMALKPS